MKQWTKSIEINAPIEEVWQYVDGDLEKMQQIMPNVVNNTPVTVTDEVVGSVFRQEYREGNRVESYDVHVIEYENTPTHKKMKVAFSLAKLFDITAKYELTAVSDSKTSLTYTTSNKALKWFVHLFLLFASEKTVVKFVEHVKKVAERNRL
ncbi:SRPBCC family protein [Paenisporosarcina indica]|uniref:SRPBCC family protein n=1 Tax=Paenisporosarcina indica TaxID=650093 RepID=UPI00094FBBA9|nr:SRPBCC family protein [Paenisporosarcina indica]